MEVSGLECKLGIIVLTVCESPASPQPSEALTNILHAGMTKLKTCTKGAGDPQIKLEKYFVRQVSLANPFPLRPYTVLTGSKLWQLEKAGAFDRIAQAYATFTNDYPLSVPLILARAEFEA